uniref:Integrase catalytic domain-containing protein n=1 Tax=Tanacetum cinerariifolium TaxID=118510 RepID=A0A6L2M763_TANCI|nr:hypothetical protein [Tanacetum cinerariifolium]
MAFGAEAMEVSLMVANTTRSIDPKHLVLKWGRRISKFFLQNFHGMKKLIHDNGQNQQVRLLMLLLTTKGLLLAVYGGRMVERNNFSPQQPPQTHRQERLTNKKSLAKRIKVNHNVIAVLIYDDYESVCRLPMLLLAAKGLLLAVYGGWMVKRDNFSPQQPSQTHRQERLTNKRWQRVKSIWNVVDCNPIVVCELLLGLQPWNLNSDYWYTVIFDYADDSKENSDDSFVKEQVSEDTSSFVESPLNVDKETSLFVDKKIEFVKPKNHDKPVRKSVRYGEGSETSFVAKGGCSCKCCLNSSETTRKKQDVKRLEVATIGFDVVISWLVLLTSGAIIMDQERTSPKTSSTSGLGSTSGIRACALRNYNLEVMEFESAQNNTTAKLLILKLVPAIAEEKINKKNDVKARSLLLMALPNEHQLTFSQYNDAKTMFAAIETRFGGNEATKKTQKRLLKQQYENFNASSTESLDSIFNRLQKIVSRLAILGVIITQEDLNSKFLRSLPLEWNTHVVVWMNKADIETISMDDFTNDINTANPAYEASTVSPNVNTASPQVSTPDFSENVMYAFMIENPNGSNLLQQDLEQIHKDDLEVMDLRWQLSLLSMKAKRAQRNQNGRFKSQDNTRKQGNNKDTSSKAMLAIDGVVFYWSDMAEEQVQTNMALMAFSDSESLEKLIGSQIIDNSKKGLGYHVVPPPHPLIYNGPTKLDLSYYGLYEFKEPDFKVYGPRDSKPHNDDKGFIDSGCLRHMTRNIAYLLDFKEFDRGYVTFGGGAHGGRIFDKGKQHRASCKSKVLNPITKLLFMLHMDLFGPTFVSSLMHKKYCLVITDDYSRFTWVLFLTTKDETSEILKNFIKEIENLVDKKLKIIRCDNGTEFKNKVMDDFCREKEIKREYSVARTPQQNEVAERMNKTPIEAARTMDEELNTIPEKESNEFIKSSVEDLVPIPSESEDISESDSECILPSDDESLSDEDAPEDNVKIYSNPLFEFDDEYISIDVNPLFDDVLENIESKDSYDSNLDDPDLLVTPFSDDNEDECFDSGGDVDEINDFEDGYYDSKGYILYLGSFLNEDLVHHDPSIHAMSVAFILEGFTDEPPLEENDDLFDLEPKNDDWKKILYDAQIDDFMSEDKILDLGIHNQIFSPTYVSLTFTDRRYIFFTYVFRIFLLYFTYPVVSHFLISSGSEDTIFDLGISAFYFSHQSGTFISFNVYPNILNESPMEICSSTRFYPNITMIWDFKAYCNLSQPISSISKVKGVFGLRLSRVYNTRTRKVEENLHIRFLENKIMIEGNGPKWLFDIDSLTQSMNYVPVAVGTISDESADASYIDTPSKDVEVGTHNENDDKDNLKVNTGCFELNTVDPSLNTASSPDPHSPTDMFKLGASDTLEATHDEFFSDRDAPEVNLRNIPNSYGVPTTSHTRIHKDHPIENVISEVQSSIQTRRMTKPTFKKGFLSAVYVEKTHVTLNTCLYACFLSQIEPTSIAKALSDSSWVEAMQEELMQFKLQQKDERGIVIRNKARFLVYQMDVKSAFLYGTNEEEVYVTQLPRFKDYGLHQAPRACLQVTQKEDGIFISQDKYVHEILKKFNYSDVKSASTTVDLEKPLVKDGDANDVDVHIYRSMIGSLVYLTTSRPNIMFARSPFKLVAYTDSDYAGATQDRKSTTGGCQFLGNRLISWQCKKQIVVATFTTEAEYVALLVAMDKYYGFKINCWITVRKLRYLSLVVPLKKVGDEAVHEELGDIMEMAATTASSLEAKQDKGSGPRCQDTILGDVEAQTRFEASSKQFNDPPLLRVNTLRCGEDSIKLKELMDFCTKLSE